MAMQTDKLVVVVTEQNWSLYLSYKTSPSLQVFENSPQAVSRSRAQDLQYGNLKILECLTLESSCHTVKGRLGSMKVNLQD